MTEARHTAPREHASDGEYTPLRIPKNRADRGALYAESGLTAEERDAMEKWCATQAPTSIGDILSPDERAVLAADLAEIARTRRSAEASAQGWVLP